MPKPTIAEGQCAPTTDAVALHHGDGRLRQRRKGMLGAHVDVHERRHSVGPFGEQLGDVGTCTEVRAGTAQHHHAHDRVDRESPTGIAECHPHVVGDGVALCFAMQRDGADRSVDLDLHVGHARTVASNSRRR
jgi:hypothetical protein